MNYNNNNDNINKDKDERYKDTLFVTHTKSYEYYESIYRNKLSIDVTLSSSVALYYLYNSFKNYIDSRNYLVDKIDTKINSGIIKKNIDFFTISHAYNKNNLTTFVLTSDGIADDKFPKKNIKIIYNQGLKGDYMVPSTNNFYFIRGVFMEDVDMEDDIHFKDKMYNCGMISCGDKYNMIMGGFDEYGTENRSNFYFNFDFDNLFTESWRRIIYPDINGISIDSDLMHKVIYDESRDSILLYDEINSNILEFIMSKYPAYNKTKWNLIANTKYKFSHNFEFSRLFYFGDNRYGDILFIGYQDNKLVSYFYFRKYKINHNDNIPINYYKLVNESNDNYWKFVPISNNSMKKRIIDCYYEKNTSTLVIVEEILDNNEIIYTTIRTPYAAVNYLKKAILLKKFGTFDLRSDIIRNKYKSYEDERNELFAIHMDYKSVNSFSNLMEFTRKNSMFDNTYDNIIKLKYNSAYYIASLQYTLKELKEQELQK